MDKIFQRLIDDNLPELSGLTVSATISVTESLANELIAILLEEEPQIESCHVRIHGGNRLTINVKSPLLPWLLKVKLKLFGSVDFTRTPVIRAFLENHVLLGKLGAWINALPRGVNIYKDQVSISIEPFITSPESRKLLGLIEAVEIKTEEGQIFFDIKARK